MPFENNNINVKYLSGKDFKTQSQGSNLARTMLLLL